jgi:hypothetical protein
LNQPTTPQNRLRRQTRLFGGLALAAVGISVLVVASQIVFAASPLWKGGPVDEALINTGKQVVLSVPTLLYIAALYFARRVFHRIGDGEIFAPANGRGLLAMGRCLLIGGLWAMVAEGLVPYAADQPIAQTMREVARTASDPVLAALGLALILIGGVMSKAARLKAAHDEIV